MVSDNYRIYHYDYLRKLPDSFTDPHDTKVFSKRVQAFFWDYNLPHVKREILGHHLDNLEDFIGMLAWYSNTELYDFDRLKNFLTKETISLCKVYHEPPEMPLPPYIDHILFDLIERIKLELKRIPNLIFLELSPIILNRLKTISFTSWDVRRTLVWENIFIK